MDRGRRIVIGQRDRGKWAAWESGVVVSGERRWGCSVARENVARRTAGSLSNRPRRRGDCDEVVIVLVYGAVNAVALGEESVEALDEDGVAVEESGDTVDDTGGINTGKPN